MEERREYLLLDCRNCGRTIPFELETGDPGLELSRIVAYEQGRPNREAILMEYTCGGCGRTYLYSSRDVYITDRFTPLQEDQEPVRVPWPPVGE